MKIFMTFYAAAHRFESPPKPINLAKRPITSGKSLPKPNSMALATPATEPAARAKMASMRAGKKSTAFDVHDGTFNNLCALA